MSGGKDAFEERLKRLGTEGGGKPQPRRLDVPKEPRPILIEEPAPKRSSAALPVVAICVLLLGSGAFATMAFMPHLVFQAFPVEGVTIEVIEEKETAPEVQAERSSSFEVASSPSAFIDTVLGMFSFGGNDLDAAPLAYLPQAPQGWVRVTETDVQQAGYYETLQTSWAQTGQKLEQNPGYSRLTAFVETFKGEDGKAAGGTRQETIAFYLHPEGGYLEVRLEFLSARRALGEATNASAWIEALAEREERQLDDGHQLERAELAGIPVTNRVGDGYAPRPIANDLDARNGLFLAVPLTHRAVMTIEGMSTPREAESLIENVDRFALNDLLAS